MLIPQNLGRHDEHGVVLGRGFLQPPQVSQGEGEVVPAGQRVRMLRPKYPGRDLQHFLVLGYCLVQPAQVSEGEGEIVPAG
jgi:hypothetical protein